MTGTSPFSPFVLRMMARKNVLAGLMFIAVAAVGLWLSRNYPVGTALRMGTGYVPRLLCWVLMGLGGIVLVQGFLERLDSVSSNESGNVSTAAPAELDHPLAGLVPIVVVTASLVAFGLSVERLGLVVAILLLTGIGGLAARGIKPWELLATALGLIALAWVIFIQGLGLTIPVWPDW